MQTARMSNWKIVKAGEEYYLNGKVFNHPKFADGTTVTTSTLSMISFAKIGKVLAVTANTTYELTWR